MAKLFYVKAIVIHCSATPPQQDIGAYEIGERQKKPPQSFTSIGYHYVIRRSGVVELGRPKDEQGAHARDGGYNHFSLGVCLVGGVDTHLAPQNNFTPAQWASLRVLIQDLKKEHPGAQVLGHRDIPGVKKACPSFDVATWLTQSGFN